MKFSILNRFGASYTWRNLDDEYFLDLQYMQICFNALDKYNENQSRKAEFYSKEAMMGT
jgi:hypothetical protein